MSTMKQNEELWLNIASSHCTLPGFVNVDNGVFFRLATFEPLFTLAGSRYAETLRRFKDAKSKHRVRYADCRKRLPFSTGSVHHILCSHFLEHVYPDEAAAILREFRRVMHDDATLHVVVPDMKQLAQRYLASEADPKACSDFVEESLLSRPARPSWIYRALELTGLFGLQHLWMYDEASVRALIADCGFQHIDKAQSRSADFEREGIHVVSVKS
ncbi:MAG: methyltransferase domain-containing protein [Myxococcota bacterium]